MTLLALLALQSTSTFVIEGHRPASEAVVGTAAMKYLPFDVPKGVTAIEIQTTIGDREGDRDTVDLGLFDPRGTVRGFRGWQGGTRRASAITGDFATTSPWAIAGPLPAGRWNLAQYYLQASSKGMDYRYVIHFRFDGPKPPRRQPPIPTVPDSGDAPGWYVGDLHSHTLSSDGALTLLALTQRHHIEGFDFLVSTEHNTTAAHWRLAETMRAVPEVTLIPGDELTTPGGHANLMGIKPGYWFDFRTQPGDGGLPRLFTEARKQGAVVVVNHPFATCTSCTWKFAPEEWRDAHGIEVWNSVWDEADEKAVILWDSMLREGKRVSAFGGTDFHRDPAPLSPATRVWAKSRRGKDIVTGLRDGHTVVMETAKGPMLDLKVAAKGRTLIPGDIESGVITCEANVEIMGGEGDILTLYTRRGIEGAPLKVTGVVFRRSIRLNGPSIGFIRLELRHSEKNAMAALTNAIFLP